MIKERNENVELIHGELSPSAAKASFNGMVEGMMQELNLERLRGFEKTGDENRLDMLRQQINHLKSQRTELNERLQMAEQLGCTVEMSLSFKLNLTK